MEKDKDAFWGIVAEKRKTRKSGSDFRLQCFGHDPFLCLFPSLVLDHVRDPSPDLAPCPYPDRHDLSLALCCLVGEVEGVVVMVRALALAPLILTLICIAAEEGRCEGEEVGS